MFIFKANDKFPLSETNLKGWSDYLVQQCKDDTAILLPSNIDFIAAININNDMMFTPILDTTDATIDDYEDYGDYTGEDA